MCRLLLSITTAIAIVVLLMVGGLTGCYQRSPAVRVAESPKPPYAPSNLTSGSVSQTSVRLQWIDNSDNEEGFRIYRDSILIETVDANVVTYQDTGLKPATTYQYVVKAYNHVGESGACLCTVKTLNPPITVTLDKIGVISDHDPFLKGAGDIYLYVAVSDGKREPRLQRIPAKGIVKLKDDETTEIGQQIFYSDCVGDELKIVAIAFEQDIFGQLEKVLLGALLSYLVGDYGAGELIVNFLQSPPSMDEGMTGETPEDDFVGAIEKIWTSAEYWGIGSYRDVQSGDLRLWFTIESSSWSPTSRETITTAPTPTPTPAPTHILIEDSFTLASFDEAAFESKYPRGRLSQYPFNEYGFYCSELFSLYENDTVGILLRSSTQICVENSLCDCGDGLVVIAFRRMSSEVIRSYAAHIISCEVDSFGNIWEATVIFSVVETGSYQLALVNESGKSASCEYIIFPRK